MPGRAGICEKFPPPQPNARRDAGAAHHAAAPEVDDGGGGVTRPPGEYRAWLDNLPENLEGSRLAEKLQIIDRTRPRRAAGDRDTARLRPRLIQEARPARPNQHSHF